MYEDRMQPGFAGMKVDSGDDRVESFPVGAAGLGLGLVCGTDANGVLVPGAGTKIRGVSLHSHFAMTGQNAYLQYDCASTMTRGLAWCRVTTGGTVTKDGPVSFAADGTVSDAGTALPNAIFRSEAITITSPDQVIVAVELHNPFAVPAATTP